jgi:hypothetical protein
MAAQIKRGEYSLPGGDLKCDNRLKQIQLKLNTLILGANIPYVNRMQQCHANASLVNNLWFSMQ